ncbi:MAG: hypothetical protein WCD72_01415 [Dehalococcoidia bacterium]
MKDTIIGIVVLIVLALLIWRWEIVPVDVTEIHFTSEPYSFETSPVTVVNKPILYLIPWREAQQSIQNTDNLTGTFSLNFVFDNGIEKESTIESIQLAPNEEEVVTAHVPLRGQVNVDTHVIPPNKLIPQKTIVKKTVSVWSRYTHAYEHNP